MHSCHFLRILTVTILLITGIQVNAQNQSETSHKGVRIGLAFSPDYCYRTLRGTDSDWLIRIRDQNEVFKIGYTAGPQFVLQLTERFMIETGVQFSSKGERTKKFEFVFGQLDPAAPVSGSFQYNYYYFDVPLKFGFFLLTGRTTLFLSAGMCNSIFFQNRTYVITEYQDGQVKRQSTTGQAFSPLMISAIASVGIEHHFARHFNLRVEPTLRHAVTPILEAPIQEYPYSAGLNVGLFFGF